MVDKFDRGSAVGSLAGLGLERKEVSSHSERERVSISETRLKTTTLESRQQSKH